MKRIALIFTLFSSLALSAQLTANPIDEARQLFICGWQIEEMPMPGGMVYNVCKLGDTPVAGIMGVNSESEGPDNAPRWMTYIAVDDVDAAVEATSGKGGTVLSPPFDVPGVGRIAIIMDPGQAVVGIMTPA